MTTIFEEVVLGNGQVTPVTFNFEEALADNAGLQGVPTISVVPIDADPQDRLEWGKMVLKSGFNFRDRITEGDEAETIEEYNRNREAAKTAWRTLNPDVFVSGTGPADIVFLDASNNAIPHAALGTAGTAPAKKIQVTLKASVVKKTDDGDVVVGVEERGLDSVWEVVCRVVSSPGGYVNTASMEITGYG